MLTGGEGEKYRCATCAKGVSVFQHSRVLATLSSLDDKAFKFVQAELDVSSRATADNERDEHGNAVVCPACHERATIRAAKRLRS